MTYLETVRLLANRPSRSKAAKKRLNWMITYAENNRTDLGSAAVAYRRIAQGNRKERQKAAEIRKYRARERARAEIRQAQEALDGYPRRTN